MKLQLTSGDATALGKAVVAATGTNPAQQHLHCVQISQNENGVMFVATDSYVAHRVIVNNSETTVARELLVNGSELSKALVSVAKNAGKNGTITLATDYSGDIIITNGKDSITIEESGYRHYPALKSIIDGVTDIESNVSFNGDKLATVVKAATLVAGKDSLITFETMNTRKPARITADNGTLSFTGVVMPCRTMADSRR